MMLSAADIDDEVELVVATSPSATPSTSSRNGSAEE
jgi:hypothetical protein